VGKGFHARGRARDGIPEGLEAEKPVAEAWLDRRGTLIAVVWKSDSKRRERTAGLKTVTKKHGFEARELTARERQNALPSFLSGDGWLRGRDVDRLSQEEAEIMAGRLLRKMRGLVTLTEAQATALQHQISQILQRRLTGQLPDRASAEQEIVRILREHLSGGAGELLQEALKDYRPTHDEP
jgi:hypothetical protein